MKSGIGSESGMLKVVGRLPGSKYECICACGQKRIVQVGHFNAGYYSSCGCNVSHHGHARNGSKSREYISYHNMLSRCHNPNNKRFGDYGGKGISVCESWKKSFDAFIADMGACPEGMQIDRIDNQKGYFPENCRWASRRQNQRNRSCSCVWIVDGKRFNTSAEAASVLGVSAATINAWCKGRTSEGRFYPAKPNCRVIPRY